VRSLYPPPTRIPKPYEEQRCITLTTTPSTWPARAGSTAAPAGTPEARLPVQDKKCAWVKRDCALLRKKQITFCFECPDFPCANLQELDRRHVQDDQISLVGNLLRIQSVGVEAWLVEQEQAWSCPSCGGSVCVMDRECYDCGVKVG
jgi:hypothetical protein